jgi:hypothetical protein
MLRTEMEQLFGVGELAQGVTGILMNISLKIAVCWKLLPCSF